MVTIYYSKYGNIPFNSEAACLAHENDIFKKNKKHFEDLCINKNLDKFSYMEGFNGSGPLFPKLRLCEFFNVSPRDLVEKLKAISFEGHWYTIENKQQNGLYLDIIEDIRKEDCLEDEDNEYEDHFATNYPFTNYAFCYIDEKGLKSYWRFEDYEFLNLAKTIVSLLGK